MAFLPENFKVKNSYLLHLKYPDRTADDNWFHSCEILNRFYQGKSYIENHNFKSKSYSTREWYQNFKVEIRDTNLLVYFPFSNQEIQVGSFPLPLELPLAHEQQKEVRVQVDSLSYKKLVIEN